VPQNENKEVKKVVKRDWSLDEGPSEVTKFFGITRRKGNEKEYKMALNEPDNGGFSDCCADSERWADNQGIGQGDSTIL